ncbi:unnamed protein product [Diamesa serratosioi]
MPFYELSQQDFHFLEEKITKEPELLTQKDPNDRYLLHWACLAGREQLVELIFEKSNPEIDAIDDSIATPLVLAALGGHFGLVKLLVSKGADVNHKKQGGHSSLQYAVSKGFRNILEFLIEQKADVNILDDRQDSALHRASALGRLHIATVLLDAGAKVNAQNKEGNTPLHLACEDEKNDICFLLLARGADPKIMNKSKETAIDMCRPGLKKQIESKFDKTEDEVQEVKNE